MLPIPDKMPRKNSRFLQWVGKVLARMQGWTIVGELANEPKLILAMAPHTSNWDFFVGVPIIFAHDSRLSVFMKKEAFFWPFTRMLRYIGFIPINRNNAGGIVGTAINEFSQRDAFWLLLTPEGTRKEVTKWKTGFLRIAQRSGTPIQLIGLDYASKRCHFGPVLRPSDNIQEDLDFCIKFSAKFSGKK